MMRDFTDRPMPVERRALIEYSVPAHTLARGDVLLIGSRRHNVCDVEPIEHPETSGDWKVAVATQAVDDGSIDARVWASHFPLTVLRPGPTCHAGGCREAATLRTNSPTEPDHLMRYGWCANHAADRVQAGHATRVEPIN